MGGCCSVSLSCDQMVNQVSKWFGSRRRYIHNLSKNLQSLEKAMGELMAKRDDVQGRVDREEFTRHRQRRAQVHVWLKSIITMENQFNDLRSTSELELQRLCLSGFCSKNVILSYRYGKRVIMKLRDVESLSSQGEFVEVTEPTGIPMVEELPIQPTIFCQETRKKVWDRLMEDEVKIVGLYGMGGVGKTTLLTQINNKFSESDGGFDLVVWIVVSKNATVCNIQRSIAKKIGLGGKEWDEKDEKERAIAIHNVLRRKKFVLLLDDIWENVSLNLIGVPYPDRENGCKVAFTTRSRDVCGWMRVDDPIEVSCLDHDKAWDLFKERVGKNTLESHPDIPELAKEVAGKCRGLPLALNVIGGTMACKKTVQEWHQAKHILKSSSKDFSCVEDEILPILKYSYDSLKGEKVKSCFLYCSLFPQDDYIEKESLVERWIGERFIDEKEGREWGLNQGYEILGTLIRASLLLDNGEYVRMHDVVREMAIWIASDLGKHKERCIIQVDVGLSEIPNVEDWKSVRRMSLMRNEIENISESHDCPELTTLFLQNNLNLVTISGEFFRSMPKLLVLDLSMNSSFNCPELTTLLLQINYILVTVSGKFLWSLPKLVVLELSENFRLSGLPEQISSLVSLRYLNLSDTFIERLPVGLQKLKMLIHLNLEGTRKLESLHGISNMPSLRTLKLRNSKLWLDISLMKELQLLERLEFISISISASLVGELLNYPRVARCIQQVVITERSEESVRVLVLPVMENLRRVAISKCGMMEIKIENISWNKTLSNLCFSNISYVEIGSCNGLQDLTWLLFAPNLVELMLWGLKELEEIISKEKVASDLDKETCNIIPFQKLQVLYLNDFPKLKSIYWKALPFQRLKLIHILGNCGKMRKLPLDSKSVLKVEEFNIFYRSEEWIKGIEWEDEATRQRFLPSCKHI